jgi:hypothetical protein
VRPYSVSRLPASRVRVRPGGTNERRRFKLSCANNLLFSRPRARCSARRGRTSWKGSSRSASPRGVSARPSRAGVETAPRIVLRRVAATVELSARPSRRPGRLRRSPAAPLLGTPSARGAGPQARLPPARAAGATCSAGPGRSSRSAGVQRARRTSPRKEAGTFPVAGRHRVCATRGRYGFRS